MDSANQDLLATSSTISSQGTSADQPRLAQEGLNSPEGSLARPAENDQNFITPDQDRRIDNPVYDVSLQAPSRATQ